MDYGSAANVIPVVYCSLTNILKCALRNFVISFLPAQGGQRSGSAYPRLAGIHSGDIFGLISWR